MVGDEGSKSAASCCAMATLGAITSVRPDPNANGAIVMVPDLPQPTGRTMPASLSTSVAKDEMASNASRCGERMRGLLIIDGCLSANGLGKGTPNQFERPASLFRFLPAGRWQPQMSTIRLHIAATDTLIGVTWNRNGGGGRLFS